MYPAEIIDSIFRLLQKDRATLSSCSAAHPFLSSIAERHLFVHLVVYIGSTRYPSAITGFLVPQLSRCLSERPYLADLVCSLTINNHSHSKTSYEEAFGELSTLLPLILGPEKVLLCNIEWTMLPEIFRSALLNTIRTPHMKEVHLRNFANFPLTALDDSRNIKTLKLDSSRCNYSETLDGDANPAPSSLESLFLTDPALRQFMPWVNSRLDSLSFLHAKHSLFPFPDLTSIFHACFGTLTSLSLDIASSFRTVYTSIVTDPGNDFSFDLSVLPYLEVVTVYAKIFAQGRTYEEDGTVCYGRMCHSSLPAITALIRTTGPSLTHVVLHLDCSIKQTLDLRDALEWEPLITLCDSLEHLLVDLCINASGYHDQLPIAEVVDSLCGNKDLSRLVEDGRLNISPFVPADF